MASTIDNVLKTVRELSFDRFVTPCFFIAHKDTASSDADSWSYSISAANLVISDKRTSNVVDYTLDFAVYDTLEKIMQRIISLALDVQLVYAGSFIPDEPSSTLLAVADTKMGSNYHPLFRKQYFSDAYITKKFNDYAAQVMNASCDEVHYATWSDEFTNEDFDCNRETHFTLWVAYQLVGDRRLYELAAQNLLQSSIFGGNPLMNGDTSYINNSSFSSSNGPGYTTTVSVGDVFQLNEDSGSSIGIENNGEIPKDMLAPWSVGSDNTLMDYYSFWYRLQLWLRDQLEQKTGDYSLRKNQVMTGKIHLDPRDSHKNLAYFDSYPWVFSPYLRGIPNVDRQDLRT